MLLIRVSTPVLYLMRMEWSKFCLSGCIEKIMIVSACIFVDAMMLIYSISYQ